MLNLSRGSKDDITFPASLAIIFYFRTRTLDGFHKKKDVCEVFHNYSGIKAGERFHS
jgi:hypothetical protein